MQDGKILSTHQAMWDKEIKPSVRHLEGRWELPPLTLRAIYHKVIQSSVHHLKGRWEVPPLTLRATITKKIQPSACYFKGKWEPRRPAFESIRSKDIRLLVHYIKSRWVNNLYAVIRYFHSLRHIKTGRLAPSQSLTLHAIYDKEILQFSRSSLFSCTFPICRAIHAH